MGWDLALERSPGKYSDCIGAKLFSEVAASLYENDGFLRRNIQKYRPYICPFEDIMPHVPARASVLDVGCGSGLFLGLLKSTADISHGTGTDICESAVGSARRMVKNIERTGQAKKLTFDHAGTIAEWPSGQFDVVSMIDVAHHVPTEMQDEFVRAAIRKVGSNGTFIYKDMARKPMWKAMANRLHDLLMARQWINYMPVERVEAIAREEGLVLKVKKDMHRFCYAHELRVFAKRDRVK